MWKSTFVYALSSFLSSIEHFSLSVSLLERYIRSTTMPLTDAQIAFETEWVERWKKLSKGRDSQAWSMLYAENATFQSTNVPMLAGRPAILKYRQHLLDVFEAFDAGNETIIIDEKYSRIIVIYDGFVTVRDDPEHQNIHIRCVRIASKDLGVAAEQMRAEELISDPTPITLRLTELGIDHSELSFKA